MQTPDSISIYDASPYDMIIDLTHAKSIINPTNNNSSEYSNILVKTCLEDLPSIIEFISKIDKRLPDGARISVELDTLIPLGSFFQLSLILEVNGYLTSEIIHDDRSGRWVVRKCAELEEDERRCIFSFGDKTFSLDYTSARDLLRRNPLHEKSFYELPLLRHFHTIERPGLLLDIGANIGNHSIYTAGVLGRHVVAYEPNPLIFEYLTINIENNNLSDLIDARRVGVSDAPTRANMGLFNRVNSGATKIVLAENGEVAVIRLDDEIPTFTEAPAILKIDVEGMEANVLRGAKTLIQTFQPIIFVESWNEEASITPTALMAEYGYTCTGMIPGVAMLQFIPQSPP